MYFSLICSIISFLKMFLIFHKWWFLKEVLKRISKRRREKSQFVADLWTKAVAAERFVKELEKNSYQSRFRISYNACQLKGNNSQIMCLTLLYCEKPMLLNLICWLVKINEFYYSPSFIYIIFSATKLQIDENHGILWENYIVQVCKVKNWRYILFVFFKKQIRHPWKKILEEKKIILAFDILNTCGRLLIIYIWWMSFKKR